MPRYKVVRVKTKRVMRKEHIDKLPKDGLKANPDITLIDIHPVRKSMIF